jgi:hypothetical protein
MRLQIFFPFVLAVFVSNAQTDLLITDFQNGIPQNYSIIDNDGLTPDLSVAEYTSAWITVTDPDSSKNTVASSTSYFYTKGTADRWLITPPLLLGNYGNFIDWRAKSQDASYPDDYLVLVSDTDDELSSFTDTIGYVIQENFEWTTRTADLSQEGYKDQTVYVAFRLVTTDGFKLFLDDIHVWKNDPVGIDEISSSIIKCYPNPTQDYINIPSDIKSEDCSVYSMDGMLLISSSEKCIDVKNLNSGMYILKVNTGRDIHSLRFIKN